MKDFERMIERLTEKAEYAESCMEDAMYSASQAESEASSAQNELYGLKSMIEELEPPTLDIGDTMEFIDDVLDMRLASVKDQLKRDIEVILKQAIEE